MLPVNDNELRLINLALAEDKGEGDWTTRWIVPARARANGVVTASEDGVIAGLNIASAVFLRLDPRVEIHANRSDGDVVRAGDVVCTVKGPARAILTGERTALNFLQRLSGIATLTRKYVDAVAGTDAVILDTRQTTPAWRELEKSAVRAGGAQNNRFGLYDMALVKTTHLAIAGGVAQALHRVHDGNTKELRVVVEVASKEDLKSALEAGCQRVRLHNMDVQAIREAVRIVRKGEKPVEIEASGNMTLDRVRAVAETGVDFISVAALTSSAAPLALSFEVSGG